MVCGMLNRKVRDVFGPCLPPFARRIRCQPNPRPCDMTITDVHRKKLCELRQFAFAELRLLGWAMTALLVATPAHAADAKNKSPKTSIPEIARIGKVQIGYSTQEDLARKWGEGKTVIGGHPNSGRVWRIKGSPWRISTDGFDYSERGLVVDQFSVGACSDLPRDVPYAKLSKRDFVWLGGISLGMSKKKVMQILKRNSLPVTPTKQGCEINARGHSPLTSIITPFRNWKATLTFTNDLLISLNLDVRIDSQAHFRSKRRAGCTSLAHPALWLGWLMSFTCAGASDPCGQW